MDLLCDDIILEILLRLPLKYLHRLRAVSRRYNALVLGPGFSSRYWLCHGPHLSGVFLQTERLLRPWGHRPCFLAAPGRRRSPVLASDLGFMPRAQAAAAAGGLPTSTSIFLVHSACGLLLCCRGRESPTQYYVCNPVTWQCVALPELPSPPPEHQSSSGLLELAGDGHGAITSFRVVLVSHPSRWPRDGGAVDLKVFSSGTGEWRATQLQAPSSNVYYASARHPTFHGQRSNAYWIVDGKRGDVQSELSAMEYDSFYNTIRETPLPVYDAAKDGWHNRCLGQRQGGGVRYAHFKEEEFEVWDLLSWRDQNGVQRPWWQPVHRIGVDELVRMNPVATGFLMRGRGVNSVGVANLAKRDDLFHVLGFHPTDDDIVYFDVERSVAAYSMVSGAITLQSPRQCFSWDVFPYAHPPYPVMIPEIKKSKLIEPRDKGRTPS